MFGHRYERGNPNLTNPRAPIPVTVTLRFDPGVVTGGAEGESHGGNGYGIQVLQNGVPVVLSKEIVLLPSGPVVPQALPLPPEPPPLCPPVEPLPMFGGDQRSVRARERLVAMLAKRRDVSRQPIQEVRDELRAADWAGRVETLIDKVAGCGRVESFAAYGVRR